MNPEDTLRAAAYTAATSTTRTLTGAGTRTITDPGWVTATAHAAETTYATTTAHVPPPPTDATPLQKAMHLLDRVAWVNEDVYNRYLELRTEITNEVNP